MTDETSRRKVIYEGYLYVRPWCGDHYFVSSKRKEPMKYVGYPIDFDEDKSVDLEDFIGRKVRITIEVLE